MKKRKARQIEPLVSKYINEFRIGSHRSWLRGWGGNFDTVRSWQAGDRRVHMPATARTGEVHTKVFQEPKQMTIWTLVDASRSMLFGAQIAKVDAALVLLACLELSAAKEGDLLGSMLFSDQLIKLNQPAQNTAVVKEAARLIFDNEAPVARTNLDAPLERLVQIGVNYSLVVIISDFLFPLRKKELGLIEQLNANPGVVVLSLVLYDQQEEARQLHGFIADVRDAENDRPMSWDFSSQSLAMAEKDFFTRWKIETFTWMRHAKAECIFLDISENFVRQLARCFAKKQPYAV